MIWQDVVLITIGLLYFIGIIYQIYVENKRKRFRFSLKNLLVDVVMFFIISVMGVFVMFSKWLLWWLDTQENPIAKTKTYTLENVLEYYKGALETLGFEYGNRVSKDNIPYMGFVYREPPRAFGWRETWVILALDKQQDGKQIVRLSSYKDTKEVNRVVALVDDLLSKKER